MFPPLARHMVRIGEEAGKLDDMLIRVADTFKTQVRKLVKRLTGLLEPVIILRLGIVLGFVVVAMLLAIFCIAISPSLDHTVERP